MTIAASSVPSRTTGPGASPRAPHSARARYPGEFLGLLARNLTNEYYLLYAADRTGGAGVPGAIGEQRGVVSRGREIALQAGLRF